MTGNTAVEGGGLLNNGFAYLTNDTFYQNKGDGLYNSSKISLTSCTIAGNTAGTLGGGGLFNKSAPATLIDTIVAGNVNAANTPSDIGGGVNVSGTYNLIGTGGSGGLVNGTGNNVVNVANAGLAPLALYGGPTQTLALKPGSPAIGIGTAVSNVTTDQRGFGLDTAPNPDIGAFQATNGWAAPFRWW